MGSADEPVPSPSFALQQEYPLADGKTTLYHLDLYRLAENDAASLAPLAIAGYLDSLPAPADALCVVEWPERLPRDVWSRAAMVVQLDYDSHPSAVEWRPAGVAAEAVDEQSRHATVTSPFADRIFAEMTA
eukprot:PLAT7746.2.p2 GENE.PLAT7746.2~~PLAT7746.2.p2  ORF type:complete len:131 (-),score=9.40 PLAT7746.2:190-582(-)